MNDQVSTAQITVKYVNQKQEGKKNASIKTDDNQLYFVAPEMISQFEQGGKYTVKYKVNNFRGVQYRHIESVDKTGAPVQQGTAVSTNNAVTKASYGTVDMATAERIFVCGAINAMMANQNVNPLAMLPEDIVQRINFLREAWRQTLGNPQQSAELNDEIPW